jgi:hypothetical protein
MTNLEIVKVWYCFSNSGDGCVNVNWYLSEEEAEKDFESQEDHFAESNIDYVETFEESNVWIEAKLNSLLFKDEYFMLVEPKTFKILLRSNEWEEVSKLAEKLNIPYEYIRCKF